jgi:FMN phosphatase YigB (HAD superfamily)
LRKAIFWGFLGTLAEPVPQAAGRDALDPRQYRVYPDAAATLALCAYKGYRNYLLAEGFPYLTELLPKLYLDSFFLDRVVSGRVELAGSSGEGVYRRAELAAHFPQKIWLVSGVPQELAGAKAAGWHTIQVHTKGMETDFTCRSLTDVWRLL